MSEPGTTHGTILHPLRLPPAPKDHGIPSSAPFARDAGEGPEVPSDIPPEDLAVRRLLLPILRLVNLARHGSKACLCVFDALAMALEDAMADLCVGKGCEAGEGLGLWEGRPVRVEVIVNAQPKAECSEMARWVKLTHMRGSDNNSAEVLPPLQAALPSRGD